MSNVQPSFFPNLLRARRELTLETETKTKGIFEAVLSYIQGEQEQVCCFLVTFTSKFCSKAIFSKYDICPHW